MFTLVQYIAGSIYSNPSRGLVLKLNINPSPSQLNLFLKRTSLLTIFQREPPTITPKEMTRACVNRPARPPGKYETTRRRRQVNRSAAHSNKLFSLF